MGVSGTVRPRTPIGCGGRSYGRDAVAAVGEVAVLAAGQADAADQVVAQLVGLDDGVDDELRGQAQQVDVGLVDRPLLGDELARSAGSAIAAILLA